MSLSAELILKCWPPAAGTTPGRLSMDRLRPFVEALRRLAQTNDPNRVVLIEETEAQDRASQWMKEAECGHLRLTGSAS
jgi:hypothetical protein